MYDRYDDWEGDPHRNNPEVHYRLYLGRSGLTVICVQDFDYSDYDARRIISSESWDRESDAQDVLLKILPLVRSLEDDLIYDLLDEDLQQRIRARAIRSKIKGTR